MSFEFEQPESIENSAGGWMTKEGLYHFIVNDINENPATKDHKPISNALGVKLEVLAGTNPDQVGKSIDLLFYKGRPEDKDKGEFAKKKLMRFFMAINLLKQHQPGAKVKIETSDGVGQQLCAKLSYRESKDGSKKFLDISFADIWHVDDSEAKDIPKDPEALGLIDASNRKNQQQEVASLVDV